MTYTVEFSSTANRQIEEIPKRIGVLLYDQAMELCEKPRPRISRHMADKQWEVRGITIEGYMMVYFIEEANREIVIAFFMKNGDPNWCNSRS